MSLIPRMFDLNEKPSAENACSGWIILISKKIKWNHKIARELGTQVTSVPSFDQKG